MVLGLLTFACTRGPVTPEETALPHFPLDDLSGVITQSGVELDRSISSDGKGSLRITALEPTTVSLFEVRNINIEDARLLYQARVRTKDVKGQVFLEMWVRIPEKGEFFTRNIHTSATGSMDWKTMEAPFYLKKGQNPDLIRLNLVIKGSGTVWIDDINLVKAPLPKMSGRTAVPPDRKVSLSSGGFSETACSQKTS